MGSFSVASYNILADAYSRPAWFVHCRPEHLDPGWRRGALAAHVAALDADVVCLQEVEPASFGALDLRLGRAGYAGHLALKGGGRPDGCATFFRTDVFPAGEVRPLYYADGRGGAPDSGHVALLAVLTHASGQTLTVANTHLRWDEPGRAREEHVGRRQASLLLDALADAFAGEAAIVCGDLNVTPGDDLIAEMKRRGLSDAYAVRDGDVTCNANARCKRIDFILHGAAFTATPVALPAIDARTPLPSAEQPSDHLAIAARLTWTGPGSPTPSR